MNTMLTIAELLAGEALISPGGPVDRLTAAADDYVLDADQGVGRTAPAATAREAAETMSRPLVERVLLPL